MKPANVETRLKASCNLLNSDGVTAEKSNSEILKSVKWQTFWKSVKTMKHDTRTVQSIRSCNVLKQIDIYTKVLSYKTFYWTQSKFAWELCISCTYNLPHCIVFEHFNSIFSGMHLTITHLKHFCYPDNSKLETLLLMCKTMVIKVKQRSAWHIFHILIFTFFCMNCYSSCSIYAGLGILTHMTSQ